MEDKRGIAGLVIASIFFGAALLWSKKDNNAKNTKIDNDSNDSWAMAAAKTSKVEAPNGGNEESKSQSNAKGGDDGKLRNVFSVKQKPIATGNGSGSKQTSSEKPFESSYYFAHNKHSTGGGYKDGLRAEDYVMNGPRLLSKGGIRIGDGEPPNNNTAENDSKECIPQSEKNDAKERPKPKLTASTPITKYMWDDDGNGNNMAKIHIDSLPIISSTNTMTWESAGISREQVEVRFIGENNDGLYVSVVTMEGKRYHLHVPKMYGEAESVKCIVKKHKLLIKIGKKKIPKRHSDRYLAEEGVWKSATKALGRFVGGGEEATKEEYISVVWPRLSASSVGGFGGGTADIDAKLFKEMDTSKNGGDVFEPLD